MANERVVILKGEPVVFEELAASEALTPGHLLQVNSGEFRKHASAAVNAAPWFALERDELGNDMDEPYAIGDTVKAGFCPPGTVVNVWLASGAGTIAYGDYLESAGDGTLKKVATDAATDDTQRVSIVGQALEAPGAVLSATRCRVIIV